MSDEKNLEKSSQDYKKSQYGSWYKKAEEKKKAQKKKELTEKKKASFFINSEMEHNENKEESLIQKFLNIFNKRSK